MWILDETRSTFALPHRPQPQPQPQPLAHLNTTAPRFTRFTLSSLTPSLALSSPHFDAPMMAGSLQTLGFRPPVAAGSGIPRRRILSFQATRVRPHGDFLSPVAPPPLTGKPLQFLRLVAVGSDQVDASGNHDSNSREDFLWVRPFLDFAATNIIPIALLSGIVLGLANPTLGCIAHRYSVAKFSTFGIFFISGLTLRSREIGAAIEAWPAGMFGLVSILLFTPLFSKLILLIQLDPQEFITGLAIFCCMPTTLSTGVALTQIVGGNSALSLAMTVMSNLLCIVTVPFSLSKLIGAGAGVSVPIMHLFKGLVITLLVPLILGKVLRDGFKSVADYVDKNRRLFSLISAIFLSLVPWIQVSRSRSLLLTVKPTMFAIAICMGTLLHLILLAFNIVAVNSLSVVSGGNKSVFAKKQNARAVIIVASEKTLPVMVAVLEQLKGLGESGLLVLPCVASHIIQIIIDSFLVNVWLQKDRLSTEAKEA